MKTDRRNSSSSKTIGARFGYSDDDLSTPGHDALVIWARRNMYQLLEEFVIPPLLEMNVRQEHDVETHERERYESELANYNLLVQRGAYDPRKPLDVRLLVEQEECWFAWYKPECEHRVPGGWIDLLTTGHAYTDSQLSTCRKFFSYIRRNWIFAIEVKTTIRSFGELLRQLRVYEEFVYGKPKYCKHSQPFGQILVLSPDIRFADDIREEGFLFYEAKIPDEVLP